MTIDVPDMPRTPGWLAHRATQIWAWCFAAAAVTILLAPGELRSPATTVLLLTAVACMPIARTHDRRLCPRCVAEWPADGEARAAHTSTFWIHHHFAPAVIAALVLYLAGTIVAGSDSLAGRVAQAVSFVVNAAVLHASRRHSQLLPWCPYCRDDGDDGDHDETPVPDPTGVKTA